MIVFYIIVGFFLTLIGVTGCILPAIPGPPLSFMALLLLSYAKDWEPFSASFLIIMGVLGALLIIVDYVIPSIGAKKYGASKYGIWFSVIGMIIGLILVPPFGVFIGAFIGAIAGELLAGKKGQTALKVGWGVFIGNMVGIGLKLAYSGFILVIYIMKMI